MIEARVLKAIAQTMACDKCPYPCEAKEKSSLGNCVMQWSKILSEVDPNTDWRVVRLIVARNFKEVKTT